MAYDPTGDGESSDSSVRMMIEHIHLNPLPSVSPIKKKDRANSC